MKRKRHPATVQWKTYQKVKSKLLKLEAERISQAKRFDNFVAFANEKYRDAQSLNDAMARILQMARVTDAFQSLEKAKVLEAVKNFRPHYKWPKTQYELTAPPPNPKAMKAWAIT